MSFYLISHGDRAREGFDPQHTVQGLKQVSSAMHHLRVIVGTLGDDPFAHIFVGTGTRFQEMLAQAEIQSLIPEGADIVATPLCGGPEGFEHPGEIILANDSRVPVGQYLGLNSWGFNAWEFVRQAANISRDGLFLAGGELLLGLGVEEPARGALYCLDHEAERIELLYQG
jgi:hypothetical protein